MYEQVSFECTQVNMDGFLNAYMIAQLHFQPKGDENKLKETINKCRDGKWSHRVTKNTWNNKKTPTKQKKAKNKQCPSDSKWLKCDKLKMIKKGIKTN